MVTRRDEILHFLKEHRGLLQEKYGVKSIALFGSFARDEAEMESDIDLLVDIPSSFENYFDLKYFLEDAFKRSVDLGKEKTLRKFIKKEIKDELIYV